MNCGCNHIILEILTLRRPTAEMLDAGHPKTGIKEGSMVISHAQQNNQMFLKSYQIDEAFLMRICGEIRRRLRSTSSYNILTVRYVPGVRTNPRSASTRDIQP